MVFFTKQHHTLNMFIIITEYSYIHHTYYYFVVQQMHTSCLFTPHAHAMTETQRMVKTRYSTENYLLSAARLNRLRKVLLNVRKVFDADRYANHRRINTGGLLLLFRKLLMCGGRGVDDERFRITDVG